MIQFTFDSVANMADADMTRAWCCIWPTCFFYKHWTVSLAVLCFFFTSLSSSFISPFHFFDGLIIVVTRHNNCDWQTRSGLPTGAYTPPTQCDPSRMFRWDALLYFYLKKIIVNSVHSEEVPTPKRRDSFVTMSLITETSSYQVIISKLSLRLI